jgi:multiple sugar transport system permease protein
MLSGIPWWTTRILSKTPKFVGLSNYLVVLTDPTFRLSIFNTFYFTAMSVIFHLLIGLAFALLLNSKNINPVARSVFRVFYVLPWVFTVTIIAIIWRLLLNPNGVIHYILNVTTCLE